MKLDFNSWEPRTYDEINMLIDQQIQIVYDTIRQENNVDVPLNYLSHSVEYCRLLGELTDYIYSLLIKE